MGPPMSICTRSRHRPMKQELEHSLTSTYAHRANSLYRPLNSSLAVRWHVIVRPLRGDSTVRAGSMAVLPASLSGSVRRIEYHLGQLRRRASRKAARRIVERQSRDRRETFVVEAHMR